MGLIFFDKLSLALIVIPSCCWILTGWFGGLSYTCPCSGRQGNDGEVLWFSMRTLNHREYFALKQLLLPAKLNETTVKLVDIIKWHHGITMQTLFFIIYLIYDVENWKVNEILI